MKKVLLIFLCLTNFTVFSQCPNDWIQLFSQQDIDDFANTYPNCTQLLDALYIEGTDITDLSGLSQITSSIDVIVIRNNTNLLSLNGLGPIEFQGGFAGLIIQDNPILQTLSSFSGTLLDDTGLFIQNNPALASLGGLEGITSVSVLTVNENDSLLNLDGLDSIGSADSFSILNNENLQNITGLSNIGGYLESVTIAHNPSLTSLNGLQSIKSVQVDGLAIVNNDSLINLEGLHGLEEVWFAIQIIDNENLSDITAINEIDVSMMQVWAMTDNPLLNSCDITSLCTFLEMDRDTFISGNNNGCNSEIEVEKSCNSLTLVENTLEDAIFLFPNPVANQLNISAKQNLEIFNTRIYSALGQLVLQSKLSAIDLSGLSNSLYFVEVITSKGTLYKRVVKNL
ncbi:MAG: T9SS type A sorting domain-containing protein [Flavobacteriaceae bacterium]|nr:T9SS type A sorting domain-containing protein [Flavobacteriaceae bacterium]